MAIIKPFKGVRPPKDLVEQVESRPYDVLNSEEAREEAGDNEKSLYHIIKPEINFEPGTKSMIRASMKVRLKISEVSGKRLAVAGRQGAVLYLCADYERQDTIWSGRWCLRE